MITALLLVAALSTNSGWAWAALAAYVFFHDCHSCSGHCCDHCD